MLDCLIEDDKDALASRKVVLLNGPLVGRNRQSLVEFLAEHAYQGRSGRPRWMMYYTVIELCWMKLSGKQCGSL